MDKWSIQPLEEALWRNEKSHENMEMRSHVRGTKDLLLIFLVPFPFYLIWNMADSNQVILHIDQGNRSPPLEAGLTLPSLDSCPTLEKLRQDYFLKGLD